VRTPAGWTSLHASALVVGEAGLLVRGPSGAGKSSLALALIAHARQTAIFAALVGDDRVFVRVRHGRLLARGVPEFAGMVERRFEGVVAVAHEPCAVARLVVDLTGRGQSTPRMPRESDKIVELLGVRLPRIALDPAHGPLDHAYAALESLARLN
jgi:serine kinase of HPr protein (carbohydrate metabolism regulator)